MTAATPPTDCDILILGASVLGVELVYQMQRRRRLSGVRVTVVDRLAEHDYIPLVHERLSGRLSAQATRLSTADYVRSLSHHSFVQGEIDSFDVERNTAQLSDGRTLRGSIVVVALGSGVAPPAAMPGREHIHALKFGPDAQQARRDLQALLDPSKPTPRLVVVGAGISGVELAGELAHMRNHPQPHTKAAHVSLVHAGPELLPGFQPHVRARAQRWLEDQGVRLLLGQRLQAAYAGRIVLQGEHGETETVHADRVYWAGGICPAPQLQHLPVDRTDDGYLRVNKHLRVLCNGQVLATLFAGGDAVRVVDGGIVWPTMQRAIEALWQAKTLAVNIDRLLATGGTTTALRAHPLRRNFAHGISLGAGSLVVWGRLLLDWPRINTWFRRFLMRRYMARYRPRA